MGVRLSVCTTHIRRD